ncbi:MAG: hypothetical protein Q9220_000167 [cf. Caloplaca sp. 1 TL-2023]
MPGTVAEGPTVAMSFANNFWGKEDAGVQPLLERMQNAKVTCDELKLFYNTRAAIEDEYSRKLLALCRKPLGSSEAGTLRASLDVVRGEVESMGKAHQGIAGQMKSELEEPLTAFAGGMKERRKIVQAGVEKLYKIKQQQTQSVNKSRDKYEQDCLKIKGYLAQGHMVMGQEERKNKAKMEKTQIQLASASNEYEAAVKALEETTGRWNRDWKAACDKFQDLEEERLDFTKSSLWTFANVASTVCVSDDASCEKVRLSLESCEVEKDIGSFIQERGTGQEIPDPPKYINFCRGELNDTASETSEDDNYSVAQFQRTLNPAFRTSSPQPSTYESHHDPQSDLAVKMGLLPGQTPPSGETTLTPQKLTHHPPPIIDYRSQPQTQAPYQHKIDDLVTVPHNEYPTDGMTMFCRTAPPSDRSSAASPMRPSSRDSQSEYSNPTSFSSQEPLSRRQSPVKHDIPPMSPSKQVQKKRSGFFSNSPFRRKSKHERDGREIPSSSTTATPTSRNTWGPSNRNGAGESPTRSYGQGVQTRDFQTEPSPEPVDPRANFQLNVGPNVFDVASPDSHRRKPAPAEPNREMDPIAQALADLKGVGKQSSVRMSADRYAGVATPAPGMTSDLAAAQRGTPPPSYQDQQPIRRLDPPKPAFTSAQMQQTTRNYVGQNQEMYGSSRPGTRGSADGPRATSPLPMRSTSPRPGYNGQNHARSASPNPYGGGRPRQTPNSSPGNRPYANGNTSRYHSPNDIRRSASPQPQHPQQQSRQQQPRPNSSAGMQLQLAPDDSSRGTNQRARGQSNARPLTYYGGQQPPQPQDTGARNRSRSVANGRQYTKEGRPILEFARALYLYNAAIPEELSFAKGDVLAVLNMQDDGWWEAEVTGKNGRPGLVPSAMHILVTNDDGPPSNQSSPYIHSFVETLQSAGHTVSVILPHQQRSWIGKAHFASQIVKPTYFRPGTLHTDDGTTHAKPLHQDSRNESEEWVLVNSTPATAAQLGLFHFFQDRGPVDLVISGPNYGRNTTSLFSLSSGTIGGALEAAVCRKRAIALSYAFFSRDHDPQIIAGASRMSVKVIEHLTQHWDKDVDLYSVNVPVVEGVEGTRVMYTFALQNYWKSGSSFTEIEAVDEEDEDPDEKEAEVREQEGKPDGGDGVEKRVRHKHTHFKWTPNFTDVYQSVETSEPGNDGWAVKEGLVSVTPLKANFMHVPGLQGELKLSFERPVLRPSLNVLVNYEDPYTHPIIVNALSSVISPEEHSFVSSFDALPSPESLFFQITPYEEIPFEYLLDHPTTFLANSYAIRKALIRKHYLAHTVHSYLTKHPDSYLRDHVPLTIDFEVDYAEFLDEALAEAYELHETFARNQDKDLRGHDWWILKPGMSDRGQGIRLFSTQSQLQSIFEKWEQDESDSEDEGSEDAQLNQHESDDPGMGSDLNPESSNRPSSKTKQPGDGIIISQLRHFIVQPYIPPLLLPEYRNRKFHVRTYVLCVGAIRVYVYRQMLALFAEVSYQAPSAGNGAIDMRPHLTNTCLQTTPTSSVDPTISSVVPFWSLSSSGLALAALQQIFDQILSTSSELFRAVAAQSTSFQPLPNAFEVFGVDWLVDSDYKTHLLEVNAFPDFAQSGSEGKEVIQGLWKCVLEVVLQGDGHGGEGFFSKKDLGGISDSRLAEEGLGTWGMTKVLDLDMGRR